VKGRLRGRRSQTATRHRVGPNCRAISCWIRA